MHSATIIIFSQTGFDRKQQQSKTIIIKIEKKSKTNKQTNNNKKKNEKKNNYTPSNITKPPAFVIEIFTRYNVRFNCILAIQFLVTRVGFGSCCSISILLYFMCRYCHEKLYALPFIYTPCRTKIQRNSACKDRRKGSRHETNPYSVCIHRHWKSSTTN